MKVIHNTSPLVSVLHNFVKFRNCYPKFRQVVLDKLGMQIGLTSI